MSAGKDAPFPSLEAEEEEGVSGTHEGERRERGRPRWLTCACARGRCVTVLCVRVRAVPSNERVKKEPASISFLLNTSNCWGMSAGKDAPFPSLGAEDEEGALSSPLLPARNESPEEERELRIRCVVVCVRSWLTVGEEGVESGSWWPRSLWVCARVFSRVCIYAYAYLCKGVCVCVCVGVGVCGCGGVGGWGGGCMREPSHRRWRVSAESAVG